MGRYEHCCLLPSTYVLKDPTKADIQVPRFNTNDTVYLQIPGGTSREGPYVVARTNTTVNPPKYVLSLVDGTPVNSGNEVEESRLGRTAS